MQIKKLVYKMLTTSTSSALCDSGDAYGRNWERNQKMKLKDFDNEPAVSYDVEDVESGDITDSKELNPTVSVFHYLTTKYELDELCDEFNRKACKDWNSDILGVSESGQEWLKIHGFEVEDSYNTYNGDCPLSQTLQGARAMLNGTAYELVQIHQGCDVRGGYTDAKLFKVCDEYAMWDIYGDIDGVDVSTSYDGVNLTDDNGNGVTVEKDSKINLYL